MKTTLKDAYTTEELLKLAQQKNPAIFERRTIPSATWKINGLNDMVFKTRGSFSKTGSIPTYTQIIRFDAIFNNKIDWSSRLIENIKSLLSSPIAVHCTCPAYELSGASYNATQGDYAAVNESLPPTREYGKNLVVCKHIVGVLKQVTGNIALITRTYKELLMEEETEKEGKL